MSKKGTPPVQPTVANGVQEDAGNSPGSRPGPKVATHASMPDPAAARPTVPPARMPDVSVAIGQPSVKDMNERKFAAKDAELRAAAHAAAAEIKREPQPGFRALRMSDLTEEEGGEAEAPAETPETPAQEDDKTPADRPTSSNEEIAAIAEKERENRQLRKKLKAIENAPKAVDKVAKLKELAKTNPRGVADYLGIPFEALSMAMLAGKPGDEVKLEDAPPPGPREPTEAEKERDAERAARIALQQQIAQGKLETTVATMVRDAKAKDGSLRWGNIVRLGDDPTDGRARAISQAQQFGAGLIDENGKRLETPRRMKRFSDKDARGVLEHFLDVEDKRLGAMSKKLGGGSSKPVPRVVQQGTRTTGPKLNYDPNNQRDPNHPFNRPTWIEKGEEVRARHFGPRR